jgi:hypothetical protein
MNKAGMVKAALALLRQQARNGNHGICAGTREIQEIDGKNWLVITFGDTKILLPEKDKSE